MRRIIIIGTGLIGTSVALAMRERGTEVLLADRDAASLELAVQLGAGTPLPEDGPDEPADLAVVAVPPAAVAPVLLDAQKRGLAHVYTDVASVKAMPLQEAAELGCDLTSYVAGHPLAGSERSGPAAARADLFLGRTWALCPVEETDSRALERVRQLATACGARTLTVPAAEHDRAVALVSHGPHVVSAAMAARLRGADDVALSLAGQGVRDVTRIAAGDPRLWLGILSANAGPVADVLEEVAADLKAAAAHLREGGEHALERVTDLLVRGNAGRARIPGKHGGRQSRYAVVPVLIPDRPGELALLFQAAGVAGVNIEDVSIEHSPGLAVGVVELSVEPEAAQRLAAELRARGWSVPG
ncbi:MULTISPECIES: prephenate dehydrogenase [Thermomonospora]|uniref:Prephenate dehydrogenase n=1 Tax=Thermomonospora curvata (strain ATCC 19995 / DSM 43183 / JCM 3096 / KCTC 9072 / NBRC 15933 / NCIMB 10081 / Henssen B9) TaxID=471852 RepID=D1A6W9_THECD|nr:MULTISPECIES: prephenate dehydrogenase [Thermomonospora]ACY98373.1 Prephenate dehydrogenase [Thermomonospora curvata DSM 43183]PKK13874.1 MAG: prephenate dehydrogenase [Thermomonospora sp. CIF 1]